MTYVVLLLAWGMAPRGAQEETFEVSSSILYSLAAPCRRWISTTVIPVLVG